MEFLILGPFEALDEGRAVAVGGGKQRALLALLLLHANETLSADRLVDELWGEHPPPAPLKTLHVYISRLRKALTTGSSDSDGLILTRGSGYQLALSPESLDSCRFEELVGDGRPELAAGLHEAALSALELAQSLWRGEPLTEFAEESFAQRESARLADLLVSACEQLVEAKLRLGRHAEVIGPLEGLVEEHPYREGPRAQLMLALYRSDRQADALQAYQDARRTLVEELGIEPGERLRELERAVLAQDTALRLVTEQEKPAAKRRRTADEPAENADGAFVGRERELATLVAGLDDALGARAWLAHTREDYARMLLARGERRDQDRAQELLTDARRAAITPA